MLMCLEVLDLPPRSSGMRWMVRYDAAEEILNAQLVMAAAWLIKQL
jgi:hypothetical protein